MAIDPITAFLLGTCMVACWPCLLPCCMLFPVPLVIVKSRDDTDRGGGGESPTAAYRFSNKIKPFYYNMALTKDGFLIKKINQRDFG